MTAALYAIARMLFPAIALTAGAAMADSTSSNPLDADRWQHRPLVVIAPAGSDNALADVKQRVEASRAAFEDRDMVLYIVTPDAVTREGEALSEEQADSLRAYVKAASAETLTLVLIGKDGGRKMRGDADTPLDAIYDRIDGMPMRQREMARDDRE